MYSHLISLATWNTSGYKSHFNPTFIQHFFLHTWTFATYPYMHVFRLWEDTERPQLGFEPGAFPLWGESLKHCAIVTPQRWRTSCNLCQVPGFKLTSTLVCTHTNTHTQCFCFSLPSPGWKYRGNSISVLIVKCRRAGLEGMHLRGSVIYCEAKLKPSRQL